MRLNSANRAFAGIVVVAAVVFGVFAATACWIFSMVAYKVVTDGLSTLTQLGTMAALLLILLLVATNALALRSFRAQAANTRRLSRWVADRSVALPPSLVDAARAARLEGRVDLVDAEGAFSFTYAHDWSTPGGPNSIRAYDNMSATGTPLGSVTFYVCSSNPC